MKLNPCPMCGSPAIEDATGCAEMYGRAWQTSYIECSKENDKHCHMEVTCHADFHELNVNSGELLANLWNSLKKASEK